MTDRYSAEAANAGLMPPAKLSDVAMRGRVKVIRGTITLDDIVAATDNVFLGKRPAGSRFGFLVLSPSVDLTTTVINVGNSKVHSNNNKYHSGSLNGLTGPQLRGLITAMDDEPLSADEDVFVTFSADPPNGTLVVDMVYYEN